MNRLKILLIGFLFLATIVSGFPVERTFGNVNDTLNFSASIKREITILDGGYIMINDTFLLMPYNEHAQLPSFYLIGIPKNYHRNLVYSSAHDPHGFLNTELFEEDETFKWFRISLMTDSIDKNQPYNFTLTTVFLDLIKRKAENVFRVEFPLYPVLRYKSDLCNVTLVLPSNAEVLPGGFPQEIFLNMTSDFRLLNNMTRPLPAYINISSWIEFSDATFSILKILEVRREISVNEWGRMYVTDLYSVEMVNAHNLSVVLPPGSTDITIYDVYGRYPENYILIERREREVIAKIFLADRIKDEAKAKIAVLYSLPIRGYTEKKSWQIYSLSINITRPNGWFIPRIAISILLPEGASIINGERHPSAKYEKIGFFQEKITFEYYNITRYEVLDLINVEYQYIVLWAAFRPTILAIALVGLAGIAVIFAKPAGKVTAATVFSPEALKAFIQKYEEMEDIFLKLDSLREEYMRGRIPKRRYQLMRKMFEKQLNAIREKFMELRKEIESAGGRYAEMMKQLEKASSDIEDAKRKLDETDLRLRRREISVEEYNRLINEYTRKIERAKSLINEIILRLKLEI